jgi:hypothetical protein
MSVSTPRAVGISSPTGAEAIHGSAATALPRLSSLSHSSTSSRAASAPAAPGGSRNHETSSASYRVADSRAVGVGSVRVGLTVGSRGAGWSPQAINRAARPASPYAQVHRVILYPVSVRNRLRGRRARATRWTLRSPRFKSFVLDASIFASIESRVILRPLCLVQACRACIAIPCRTPPAPSPWPQSSSAEGP